MTQEGLDRFASQRVNICVREGQVFPLLNGMPLDTADVYFEHRLLKPLISTILGIFSYQLHEDSLWGLKSPLPLEDTTKPKVSVLTT